MAYKKIDKKKFVRHLTQNYKAITIIGLKIPATTKNIDLMEALDDMDDGKFLGYDCAVQGVDTDAFYVGIVKIANFNNSSQIKMDKLPDMIKLAVDMKKTLMYFWDEKNYGIHTILCDGSF